MTTLILQCVKMIIHMTWSQGKYVGADVKSFLFHTNLLIKLWDRIHLTIQMWK